MGVFLELVFDKKGKGGGGGGKGPLAAAEADTWDRGTGTVVEDVGVVCEGEAGGQVDDDMAASPGDVGGESGETSGPLMSAAAFLLLRGLGTGVA